MWSSFEKDPVFSRDLASLTVKEQIEKVFLQTKRLFEMNPVPDEELFANPIREFAMAEILGMYNFSLYGRYTLSLRVRDQVIFCLWSVCGISCLCLFLVWLKYPAGEKTSRHKQKFTSKWINRAVFCSLVNSVADVREHSTSSRF